MGYRVAVVGATGNVGRELLNILAERQFPLDEVAAVASSRSTGNEIEFGETDEMLKVKNLEHFDFSGWDIALFAAGSEVSRIYAPKAAAAGCTVIDNSSLFRMDPDVPLIVPEVNSDAIAGYRKKNIIANPNCSTAQLVVALKPLHDAARIKRVVVATYQSVSGTGKAAMDELFEQSRNIFVGDTSEPRHFSKAHLAHLVGKRGETGRNALHFIEKVPHQLAQRHLDCDRHPVCAEYRRLPDLGLVLMEKLHNAAKILRLDDDRERDPRLADFRDEMLVGEKVG